LADVVAASDERFRSIFKCSIAGIAIVDLNGCCLVVNLLTSWRARR
jgi:PAS domain-containing protein